MWCVPWLSSRKMNRLRFFALGFDYARTRPNEAGA